MVQPYRATYKQTNELRKSQVQTEHSGHSDPGREEQTQATA